MVGGNTALIFQVLFLGPWVSLTGGKKMGLLGLKQNKVLASIIELIEAGKVAPVIDRRYPLSEAGEALRHVGEGHVQGKVIITVEQNSNPEKP